MLTWVQEVDLGVESTRQQYFLLTRAPPSLWNNLTHSWGKILMGYFFAYKDSVWLIYLMEAHFGLHVTQFLSAGFLGDLTSLIA